MNKIRVGTRGSRLAVAQTQGFLSQLKAIHPDIEFEIITIQTSGDLGLLQELGAFVKEVEIALLQDKIDLAVHSYKDMPTDIQAGLSISCLPKRADVREALITKHHCSFWDLPQNATLGTSSQRRALQLQALRTDIKIVPLNGNIFTRMDKTLQGDLDGVILALAGLERASVADKADYIFSVEEMLPAVAQAALAIETRKGDSELINLLTPLHDKETEICVETERLFLSQMGGGCRMPMGALALINGDRLSMSVYYSDGKQNILQSAEMNVSEANTLAKLLSEQVKVLLG